TRKENIASRRHSLRKLGVIGRTAQSRLIEVQIEHDGARLAGDDRTDQIGMATTSERPLLVQLAECRLIDAHDDDRQRRCPCATQLEEPAERPVLELLKPTGCGERRSEQPGQQCDAMGAGELDDQGHTPIPARKVSTTACTSVRCERLGKWPPPSTTCRRAPGIVSATRRDIATVGKWSAEPAITSTGHRMRAQSASHSVRE